jgi:hypothetical protein
MTGVHKAVDYETGDVELFFQSIVAYDVPKDAETSVH